MLRAAIQPPKRVSLVKHLPR